MPRSGEGFTRGVASALRCAILTTRCSPARRRLGFSRPIALSQALVASCRSRDAALATPNSTPWVNTVCPFRSPYAFCGTALIELLDDRPVQLLGTLARKTPPPLMFRYWPDGDGTGWPGVPTDRGVSSPDSPRRASSPVDLAGGSAANFALVGSNWLVSAALAMVKASASFVM